MKDYRNIAERYVLEGYHCFFSEICWGKSVTLAYTDLITSIVCSVVSSYNYRNKKGKYTTDQPLTEFKTVFRDVLTKGQNVERYTSALLYYGQISLAHAEAIKKVAEAFKDRLIEGRNACKEVMKKTKLETDGVKKRPIYWELANSLIDLNGDLLEALTLSLNEVDNLEVGGF